jgi:6-pyruvoyltetrahydropterin/6-carboxytetrahydropterin synthase
MIQIRKEFRFEASHILPNHPGKCANLHGHCWVLEVGIEGFPDKATGFVLDYYQLSAFMSPLIDCLDHTHLNFLIRYPSSENLLIALAQVIAPLAGEGGLGDIQLTLKETQKTAATLFVRDLGMIASHDPQIQMPDPKEIIEGSIVKPPEAVIQRKQESFIQAIALSRDTMARVLNQRRRGSR